MPRRKKLPPVPDYEGMTNNEAKRVVQKSNPLQTLSETSLTLSEFKILDVYLSKIDSHNPDKRYVRFEKGELEQLLGVSRMHRDELERRLKNLFQVLKIQDKHKSKGFSLIALFEKAECEQDEDGLWQVDLACSASAMEYVFNIDSIGYLRYRLRNVINLTSRYSYILFLYLENNRYRNEWTTPLEELKKLLNCTADSYDEFKVFNRNILKQCHKELTEKTELRFTYEPVKKGRKVAAIHFKLETFAEQVAEQIALFDEQPTQLELPDERELTPHEQELDFLRGACENAFDFAEMEEIFAVLANIPLPPNPQDVPPKKSFARYSFLRELYARMMIQNRKQAIRNQHRYFVKMLKDEQAKTTGE